MEEIRNVLHFIFLINTQGFKSFAPLAMRYASLTEPKTMTIHCVYRQKVSQFSRKFSLCRITSGPGFFQKLDNLVHLINHYPANKYEGNQLF